MGFWDSVGKAASAVGGAINEHNEKVNQLAESYQNESDDYLKRKTQSGSIQEKLAAGKVLKSRGYDFKS